MHSSSSDDDGDANSGALRPIPLEESRKRLLDSETRPTENAETEHAVPSQPARSAGSPMNVAKSSESDDSLVPLDQVARVWGMTRKDVWEFLRDESVPVRQGRSETGAEITGIAQETMLQLKRRLTKLPTAQAASTPERVETDDLLVHPSNDRPLWEYVRALERNQEKLAFEVKVLAGQLADTRDALSMTESGYRNTVLRLTAVEQDLERELDATPEREELSERLRKALAENDGLQRSLRSTMKTLRMLEAERDEWKTLAMDVKRAKVRTLLRERKDLEMASEESAKRIAELEAEIDLMRRPSE